MTTILPCTNDNRKTIVNGINQYNLSNVPALADIWTPLEFTAHDDNNNIIGGILGGIGYWNGLEINILWVDEAQRGKGIGKQLLQHIETVAREKGATVAMLDTFDFQAEGFYLKNGYEIIGEVNNFPNGHRRIYFSKRLD
jgi:GNAT superfamily N-acetyltransferase